MNGRRLLRELPLGLLIVALVGGISVFTYWRRDQQRPRGVVPAAGQTLTGDAARQLHPEVAPPPVDRTKFATLPPECGCRLGSGGRAQLLMHVKGRQLSITDRGNASYVVHEVAVALEGDGGERVVKLPVSDGVAPPGRTEGFATRFDVACDGDRMLVVDPTHATLWDLGADTPRPVWTRALPARRTPVVAGESLAIECGAVRLEDGVAVVDEGGPLRLGMSDGADR